MLWIYVSIFLLIISLGLLVYFTIYVRKIFKNRRIALSKYLNITVTLFSFMILSYTGIALSNCMTNEKPILIDPVIIEGKINDVKKDLFFSTINSCDVKIWKKSEKGDSIINIYGDPEAKPSRSKSKNYLITKVIDTKAFLFYDGEHQEYKVWDINGEECEGEKYNGGFHTIINDSVCYYVWIKDKDNNKPYDDNKLVRFMHSFDAKYGIEIVYKKGVEEKIKDKLQDKWGTIEYFNEIRRYLLVVESLSEAGLINNQKPNDK